MAPIGKRKIFITKTTTVPTYADLRISINCFGWYYLETKMEIDKDCEKFCNIESSCLSGLMFITCVEFGIYIVFYIIRIRITENKC